VVAPSADVLANAVLPIRTKDGLELFRDTRTGMWFSEELKAAKAVGYIVDVIHSYTFKKGINIFSGFINTLYAMKSANDLNPSKRQTAKLVNVINTGTRNDLYESAAKAVVEAIKTDSNPKAVKNRPNY
jgi:hypothetical protein